MKYKPLPKELYIKNRQKLLSCLDKNSVAVFNSNDIMPTNADGVMPFRQNNDLLYFSGIDQEETILVIAPNASNPKYKEVLFIRETSEEIVIWEGAKLTKEQATELSGIETVFWTSQFEHVFNAIVQEADCIYLNKNEHLRADSPVETRDDRFRKWCKEKYPLHTYKRLAPICRKLRPIKEQYEIEVIQKACDITEKGLRRILKFIKPGVFEYEIEAELAHEFLRNCSRGFAYQPIIASGFNACVLHYIDNNQPCNDGDLLLMDFGAEYANYASDLTRTVPVNGKFTKRQKDIYNAVLKVKKEAEKMLVPGTLHEEYHTEVGRIMESELINLGLIDKHDVKKQDPKNPLYKKYFMHGTSHHLGLDVHDVEERTRRFEENMVFTCEPGIYIREESIGVRLEDDLVVKSGSPVNLMANIPIEVEEIEDLMNA
ncbi:MAG: aminopeptidase P family protein [Vicingaceae bacterium]